jgi:hypothetical protein
MSDFVFVAALIAFFVICALYVHLCDRMIGPDDPTLGQGTDSPIDAVSANVVVASSIATEVTA